MIAVSVRIDRSSYQRALSIYDHGTVQKAVKSSLRKMSKSASSEASKAIRDKFKIKARDVSRKIKISHRHSIGSPESEIMVSSKSIGLLNFGATATRGTLKTFRGARGGGLAQQRLKRTGRTQGVTVAIVKPQFITRGSGRRVGSKTHLPNAFIARGRRGRGSGASLSYQNAQVFTRTENGIISLRVISVSSMFVQEGVQDRIQDLLDKKWTRLFDSELRYYLNKAAGVF